jgi:choline monooxygenase
MNPQDDLPENTYGPTLARQVGLPGRAFTDEAHFRLEAKSLFQASWCCIGLAEDVAQLHRAFPVDLLGQPLLIVRNASGIEVFHNVCSHRGAQLVAQPTTFGGNHHIVCPYHSWTYSLDGKLLRTPHAGGAGVHDDPAIDRPNCGLKKVRAAVWNGLVFVNLSGTALPFEEFIAPLEQRTDFLRTGRLCLDSAHGQSAVMRSNWKIVVENFVESYHVPPVHRDLERVNPMALHYQILGGASYVGQGGDGVDWQKAGSARDLPARPPGRFERVSQYEVFWLFPNLIFGPVGNLCFVIILFPQSAALTHERLEFFFYGDQALETSYSEERQSQVDFLVQVNREDIGICERVQAGRNSNGFTGGVFCPQQETGSFRVQQIIAANLCASSNPDRRTPVDFSFEDIHHRVQESNERPGKNAP